MYSKSTYNIGRYEIISFRDENGCGIDVIPMLGGVIHQLYLGSPPKPILLGLEEADVAENNPLYKQTILFPFPNRLSNGKYNYKDVDYQFPLNEPGLNNALHGFLNNSEFELDEVNEEGNELKLRLVYEYDGRHDYYPFPCSVNIEYRLLSTSLSVILEIENTGLSELIYGIGWHPYFKFENNIEVKLPLSLKYLVDRQMIPDGREERVEEFVNGSQIKAGLDSCFRIYDNDQLYIELSEANNHKLVICADEYMNYFQLYSPADNIIAVEPMSCSIDAFNNGKGLIELLPGESQSHLLKLQYQTLKAKV